MDETRFDHLARRLAGGTTRRGFLGGLAALVGGFALASPVEAACPPGQSYGSGRRCLCKRTGRPPVGGICPCPAGQTDTGDGRGCLECRSADECDTGAKGQCAVATCSPSGACRVQTIVCQSGNPCLTASCDPSVGCVTTPVPNGEQGGCDTDQICVDQVCKVENGGDCATSGVCASGTCCPAGSPIVGQCGLGNGASCGTDDAVCCSGSCVGGVCATPGGVGQTCDPGDTGDCATGLTCCPASGGSVCRNLQIDEANCGACDEPCSGGQECVGGICQAISCPTPLCDGVCCPSETECCAGNCRSDSSYEFDDFNCGSCGVACPSGTTCTNGQCTDPNLVCSSSDNYASCAGGVFCCSGVCCTDQTVIACVAGACSGAGGQPGDPCPPGGGVACASGFCDPPGVCR